MNELFTLLEANNHSIKFECNRCHIEMYGQLTEINLRQKYFRIRIKDSSGYGTNTYEKSNILEFQIGSHARKGCIDNEKKSLEDHLPIIYTYILEAWGVPPSRYITQTLVFIGVLVFLKVFYHEQKT